MLGPEEAWGFDMIIPSSVRVAIHVMGATGSYQKEPKVEGVVSKPDPVHEVRALSAHIVLEYLNKIGG
jgi:hypothetical protein